MCAQTGTQAFYFILCVRIKQKYFINIETVNTALDTGMINQVEIISNPFPEELFLLDHVLMLSL